MYFTRTPQFSHKVSGEPFSHEEKVQVFLKATPIPGADVNLRRDKCGAVIDFRAYGDTTPGGRGWEIDHIVPRARGGQTVLNNLQPLQWQNNREKSDKPDYFWVCRITAQGTR